MQTGQQAQGQPAAQAPPQGQVAEVQTIPPTGETPNSQAVTGSDGVAPTTPPPQAPVTPGPDGSPQGGSEGDGVQSADGGFLVKSDAFKRIKDKSRAKGRQEGLEEFAREQGFNSVEEMQAALKGGGTSSPRAGRNRSKRRRRANRSDRASGATAAQGSDMQNGNGQQDPAPNGADGAGDGEAQALDIQQIRRDMRRMERKLERAEAKNTDLSKVARRETNSRKKLRQERDALAAEMIVRETAVRSGINDVDYAIRLLTRHLDGKSVEDLEGFDEAKFFGNLKDDHAYLFGQRSQPATTGNSAGDSPSTPAPGAVQGGTAQGGQVDARKMNDQEFRAHLKSRGLSSGL